MCYDGGSKFNKAKYTTYFGAEDFHRIFPYMSPDAVVKALGDLKNEGLVKEIHRGHVSLYTLI